MDRCSECTTLAYSHGLCRHHYALRRRLGTLPTLSARQAPQVPRPIHAAYTEPLLRCERPNCKRRYAEREAYRAYAGRWRDHLCGPCRHPLQDASYIDPQTGHVLVAWAA